MKCKRDTDGRKFSHETLQTMRQQAVKAVRNGQSAAEVARSFGLNEGTVYRWLALYTAGGQNALLAKQIPGRPPTLNAKQLQWLSHTLKTKTPQQWKFEFALWTLELIGEVVRARFAVSLSKPTLSRLLRTLGFSVQRPLYRAWQQDPGVVERWLADEFPKIRRAARKAGATVFFADESGIRSDYHTGTTWSPRGQTPIVKATGARYSVTMLSAVSPKGEFRFMVHEGTVTARVFRDFLARLLVGQTRPVYLIVDGHPTHKAKLVRDFVGRQKGRLKLFMLPPYSPELNPDELVWKHIKQRVAKAVATTKEEMKQQVQRALRALQYAPHIVAGFFRHPTCAYAA
jgi:transposase